MKYRTYFQVKGMKEINASNPQEARTKFLAWAKSITPRTLAKYLHLVLPQDAPEIVRVDEDHKGQICHEKRNRNAGT